jgi:hypothetical protein
MVVSVVGAMLPPPAPPAPPCPPVPALVVVVEEPPVPTVEEPPVEEPPVEEPTVEEVLVEAPLPVTLPLVESGVTVLPHATAAIVSRSAAGGRRERLCIGSGGRA